mgnify:CR=1 FL=1
MKTYHIKDLLKKEILIIELPKNNWLSVFPRLIWICDRETNEYHHIKGSYTILGSPDEIKEEDVKDLVEKITTRQYKNYGYVPHYFGYLLSTALESFNSALEKEILWENPYGKEPIENLQSSTFGGEKTIIHRNQMNILWHEAESRTFDKKRVKIFVKN